MNYVIKMMLLYHTQLTGKRFDQLLRYSRLFRTMATCRACSRQPERARWKKHWRVPDKGKHPGLILDIEAKRVILSHKALDMSQDSCHMATHPRRKEENRIIQQARVKR